MSNFNFYIFLAWGFHLPILFIFIFYYFFLIGENVSTHAVPTFRRHGRECKDGRILYLYHSVSNLSTSFLGSMQKQFVLNWFVLTDKTMLTFLQ